MPAQLSAVSNNQSLLFLYDKYARFIQRRTQPVFCLLGDDHRDNEKYGKY